MVANCTQSVQKTRKNERIVPGGYFCRQLIDEIAMSNADILRSVDAITGANVPKEEIYRIVARICDQTHKSNKIVSQLILIYMER